MTRYIVDIPIIRKNFHKTKAAKFKGILSLVTNKHGVIYDYKITFSEVHIDLYLTKSKYLKKDIIWKRGESLFCKLGLKQEIRPSEQDHKIIKLDEKQLTITNNFFNNRKKYDSTIKNIVGVLKGSNPNGEAEEPSRAEMVIMDDNIEANNFVILIDDLMMKQGVEYDHAIIGAQKISLDEFVKLNQTIKAAFDFMQKSKDYKSWNNYLDGIREYYKKYNTNVNYAEKIVAKARSAYNVNIDKNIKKFPFGFTDKEDFTKCHIYECHDIRDLIIEALRNQKSYDKYENMIKDYENFIPLPGEIHRKFDQNYFTYKLDGNIYPINEKGFEYIKRKLEVIENKKFKKLPDFFLTEKRKKYLSKRNENIIF